MGPLGLSAGQAVVIFESPVRVLIEDGPLRHVRRRHQSIVRADTQTFFRKNVTNFLTSAPTKRLHHPLGPSLKMGVKEWTSLPTKIVPLLPEPPVPVALGTAYMRLDISAGGNRVGAGRRHTAFTNAGSSGLTPRRTDGRCYDTKYCPSGRTG